MRQKHSSILLAFLLIGCEHGRQSSPAIPTNSPVLTTAPAHANGYLRTLSWPRLRIKSVKSPQHPSRPLEVILEFACDGETAVAVAQEQFSIYVFTDDAPYRFVADATFPTGVPRVLIVTPHQSMTLTVYADRNRFDDRERWSDLRPGNYKICVYINSGKDQEFDYHWLGQTHSDERPLLIK
jgi:hypothetical protein